MRRLAVGGGGVPRLLMAIAGPAAVAEAMRAQSFCLHNGPAVPPARAGAALV